MRSLPDRQNDGYTEAEAAHILDISIERLHKLLDENVFNDGSHRPQGLMLRSSDLLLLEYWNRSTEHTKVLRMPGRR
jgi:hypothetical protein